MAVTEEMVREQLRKVIDPELFVNIVDLGLIYVIELLEGAERAADDAAAAEAEAGADVAEASEQAAEAGPAESTGDDQPDAGEQPSDGGVKVKIDMTMTSPMCPAGPQLVGNSKQVVSQIDGVGDVEVRVVMDPPWTPDKMTDDAKDQLGIF